MLFKGERTPFIRGMGGFVAHLNMPGLLDPNSRDHGHGPLAMVVESILDQGRIIAMHEHRNDEIISWVPDGIMRHADKAKGRLVIDNRNLMVMNAGRSFWHSEETLPTDPPLRMLQILIRPSALDLEPRIRHGAIEPFQANDWRHLVGPEKSEAPFHVRSAVDFFDIRIEPGVTVDFPAKRGCDLYFYIFSGSIFVEGVSFKEGEQGLFKGGGALSLEAREPTLLVAFLIERNAKVSRAGTVGDHPRIPPVWALRLYAGWKRFRRFRRG